MTWIVQSLGSSVKLSTHVFIGPALWNKVKSKLKRMKVCPHTKCPATWMNSCGGRGMGRTRGWLSTASWEDVDQQYLYKRGSSQQYMPNHFFFFKATTLFIYIFLEPRMPFFKATPHAKDFGKQRGWFHQKQLRHKTYTGNVSVIIILFLVLSS